MKYINKLYTAFLMLAAITFAACDQDNEGATYTGEGVTFANSSLAPVAVPADNPTFTVDIFRSNTNGALTGSVQLTAVLSTDKTKTPQAGYTVSDYSFADGEAMTTVTVDISPAQVGEVINITLALPDESVSVGGIPTTSVSANKEYNWVSLGVGTLQDAFLYGVTCEVEIQKAEGFERWRVVEPFTEAMAYAKANGDTWVADEGPAYLEFYNNADGTIGYGAFFTGQNYNGSNSDPVNAYYPTALGCDPSNNAWSGNVAYLAPVYYVPSQGIWWGDTSVSPTIAITLP